MGQKFHGLELSLNGVAKNFTFETLAADPLPLKAGRCWINSTTKAFKYSALDAGGAVVVRSFADAESMTASIQSLTNDLAAEVTARQGAISAEAAARVQAVSDLNTAIAAESAARVADQATETQARIDGDAAEATARTAAIAVASATAADQLATETQSRIDGDAAVDGRVDTVQAELDATQTAVGLNVDGTFSAPLNTTYLGATTSVKGMSVALDVAIAAEAATRLGQVAALSSGLANETQSRIDGDTALQTTLQAYIDSAVTNNTNADNAETIRAIAKENALQAELDRTQATVGTDSDGNLIPITGTHYLDSATTVFGGAFILDTQIFNANQAIAAETAARVAANTSFNTSLNTEIDNRTAADTAQQAELDSIEAGAGLETDGSYASPTGSNYLNSAISLKDADFKLDAALKSVETALGVVTSTSLPAINSAIAAETAARIAADSSEAAARSAADSLQTTALADEVSRAIGVEAGIASDLAAEVTARQTAVSSVTAALASETSRATGVENGLQTQIDSIVAASGEGAAALKTTLNDGRFTYQSPTASLTHTIAHGLGTAFYLAQIMVEHTDGVWRNDIMPVEEVDNNSFTISLTEACRVKVSVMDMSALV